TGGAAGHDSLEDARATGELVRWKVGRVWMDLRREGWRIVGGRLLGPEGEGGGKRKREEGEGDGVVGLES
ncbi:hypothetical protein LTR28_008732, partial [Elasticomyces elasticus]